MRKACEELLELQRSAGRQLIGGVRLQTFSGYVAGAIRATPWLLPGGQNRPSKPVGRNVTSVVGTDVVTRRILGVLPL